MSVRLKKLTVVYLAVIYGLVGFTGESLHYLVEDISLIASSDPADVSGGYFHSHQPDYHVHFHHYHHHGENQTTAASSRDNSRTEPVGGSLNTGEQFHHLHACPLLTIVSQLKLGQGGCVLAIVDFDESHVAVGERNTCRLLEAVFSSLARGPPAIGFLA